MLEPNIDVRRWAIGEGEEDSVGVPTFVGVEEVGEMGNVDTDAERERLGRFLSSKRERPEMDRWRTEDPAGLRDEVTTVGDARTLDDGESCKGSTGISAHVK